VVVSHVRALSGAFCALRVAFSTLAYPWKADPMQCADPMEGVDLRAPTHRKAVRERAVPHSEID
jgi:hypothetical protein